MVKFWQGLTVFLISCLLLISLTACGNQVRRNQVVISVLSDPKTFNAVLSAESPNIFGLTYEGLLTENPITGKKEPVLAESWTISDDNLSIIFTIREIGRASCRERVFRAV